MKRYSCWLAVVIFCCLGFWQACYSADSYGYDVTDEASLNSALLDNDSNHLSKNLNIQSNITLTDYIASPDHITGNDININGNQKTLDGANNDGFSFELDSTNGTFNLCDYGYQTNGNITNAIKNFSSWSGGAVDLVGTTTNSINANVVNSVFLNNNAKFGGAISNKNNSILSVINSYFSGNNATEEIATDWFSGVGGAISNNNDINFYPTSVYVLNSDFINNYAQKGGGAIANYYGSMLGIDSSRFIGNYSMLSTYPQGNFGGAILNLNALADIKNSTFEGNGIKGYNVSTHSGGTPITPYGGVFGNYYFGTNAILRTEADLVISNSTFKNNASIMGGGVLYNEAQPDGISVPLAKAKADIIYSSFTGNNAGIAGGVIENYIDAQTPTSTQTVAEVTVSNSDFTGNYSHVAGGAILNENDNSSSTTSSKVNIINSNFTDNHTIEANSIGGAICNNDGILTIAGDKGSTNFSGNYQIAIDGTTHVANDIYMNGGTLNLYAGNSGAVTFNDGIMGRNGYKINVNPDSIYGNNGNVIFNSTVENADITVKNGMLIFIITVLRQSYNLTPV